jgi:hypothetical protein
MNNMYYDQIEDYHLGRLTAAESEAFKAALANDPALSAALRESRLMWEAQELLAEQILRAQVRQAFVEQQPPPSARPAFSWKWILSIFLLLLLLAGGIFFWQKTPPAPVVPPPVDTPVPNQPPAPVQEDKGKNQAVPPPPIAEVPKSKPSVRQLAMAAYRPPDGLTQTRGTTTSDTLALAYTAFSEKKYAQVVRLLTTLPEDDPQEALSLRAHAHFAATQYAAARRDFKDLETGGVFRREAQWFGLLAYMATSTSDQAVWRKTLQAIKDDLTHPYQPAAESLCGKIGEE